MLNLAVMLEESARRVPEGTAIVFGEHRLSYAELDDQVSRFAEALRAFGVRPGDRVATLLHNSIEFVVTFLATLRVGAIALPILIFLLKFGWPRIRNFFDDGMKDLGNESDRVKQGG